MILAPVIVRCPSNGHSASSTSGLLAPAAQTSAGRAACSCLPWLAVMSLRPHRPYYSHRWPGHPSNHHTPCYSAATAASHRSRTSEPSYSSPRGHPLPHLPRLRIVPFLGLAVVHCLGALGAVWSTWSTNESHRKMTVCERLTVGTHHAHGRCMQRNAARSTWSRNDFHRTWTVCGEADS